MAIFTAIGAAIAAAVGFAGTAFTIAGIGLTLGGVLVASTIAAGLAIATARALTPGLRGGAGGVDQGVRIQLPPATENKVPVIYGRVFQQGIVTDAHLTSSDGKTNDTMTYVITISEKTTTGNWTAHNIYWNDQKLFFQGDGITIDYGMPPDGIANNNLNGLVKIWMWAGGSASTNNLGIAGNAAPNVNAYDVIPTADNTYLMSALVFAVIQVKYDAEKGVTGLPTITFEIENSLKNPGNVIADYLLNDRYGCGLPTASVNTATMYGSASTATCLAAWSDTIPPNQFLADGTTPSTQARYEINGVLNTGDSLKANLDRLALASSSWLIFDGKNGEWKVVLNKQATTDQLNNAMLFNDDNIIGEITLTSTNLEDLYNQIEIQYPNRNTRDQSDFYKTEIASIDRNQLEEDNILRMRVDMVNSKIHAGRIGNITLKQTRIDLVIQFTCDYSALQVEAGDIIKVTNPIYDFNAKLFRVMKVRETEGEDGTLACEITALEYNASVYTDETLSDGADQPNNNIPPFDSSASLPPPSKPLITNLNPTDNTPNFTLTTTLATNTNRVAFVEWFHSTNSSTGFTWLDNSIAANYYAGGDVVSDVITAYVEAGTWYFKARTGVGGLYSELSEVSDALVWDPQPAGANNGTINSSTQAATVFINNASSGEYNIAFTTGTGQFSSISVDADLDYNATTNKMRIAGWEVSTNTDAVYVEYISTQTTTLTAVTASQAITFTELKNNGSIIPINTTTLVSPSTGTYLVAWRVQFGNAENNVTHRARVWLKENGTDLPRSATTISVPGAHGGDDGFAVLSANFIYSSNVGDSYELHWSAEDLDVSLETTAAGTNPVYPIAPAVVLTAYKLVGGYG
jgi:hypothetical protein